MTTFKPTYADMAEAVSALAIEHLQMVFDIDDGRAIGPSARDIAAGAVDPRKRAICVAEAANVLRALAQSNGRAAA